MTAFPALQVKVTDDALNVEPGSGLAITDFAGAAGAAGVPALEYVDSLVRHPPPTHDSSRTCTVLPAGMPVTVLDKALPW